MPTPSDSLPAGEWAARTDHPKRSVFGNYGASETSACGNSSVHRHSAGVRPQERTSLQAGIDLAIARSFIHRCLATAYEYPSPETWGWLCAPTTQASLRKTWALVAPGKTLALQFSASGLEEFHNAYSSAFGHAARGVCPLNEIEYGDLKADPLFQPHRLADLAAFYRAFGLDVAEEAGERHDHLCLQLEFLCVLAAKEAYALEHQLDAAQLDLCREAQKLFLREHLGRWTPAFTRRLAAATNNCALRALADFTRTFIECECARFGVNPGSRELALRPVDEVADRMCESCGLNNLPPGALAST